MKAAHKKLYQTKQKQIIGKAIQLQICSSFALSRNWLFGRLA
jgi:hypothetical protein